MVEPPFQEFYFQPHLIKTFPHKFPEWRNMVQEYALHRCLITVSNLQMFLIQCFNVLCWGKMLCNAISKHQAFRYTDLCIPDEKFYVKKKAFRWWLYVYCFGDCKAEKCDWPKHVLKRNASSGCLWDNRPNHLFQCIYMGITREMSEHSNAWEWKLWTFLARHLCERKDTRMDNFCRFKNHFQDTHLKTKSLL